MWPENGNLANDPMTWYSAIDYANNHTLCGYSDWRLPNVNELESLVNADVSNTATWLNGQGFTNVQAFGYYWSSTTSAVSTGTAWVVVIGLGDVFYVYKGEGSYVWPVRTGQFGLFDYSEIWKTGQTVSYRTRDDGDLEMGVAWPSSRFIDNGNGTVTDNLTRLIWFKDANCIKTNYPAIDSDGTVIWQQALDFVKGINNGTYSQCGAGYNDWRLPNRKELRSLIDYSRYNPALPAGAPFTNVQVVYRADRYWSSTTRAYGTVGAWYVSMGYGVVDDANKDVGYYVWPVRAGQSETIITSTIDCTGAPVAPCGSSLSSSITFTFSGTDDTTPSNDLTFQCSLDNATFSTCTSPATYTGLATGTHSFQVQAVDAAGNVDPTPAVFTWTILTPQQAIQNLIVQVQGLVPPLNQGQANGLIAKLNQAILQLNNGNPNTAVNQLNAFINQVNAFMSGNNPILTQAQGQPLIDAAQAIINALIAC
jgi:hypothetical protein